MTDFIKLKLLAQIVAITEKAKIEETDLEFLPTNYKLMHCASNTECGNYQYHGLIVYNESENEIIISNYGTHINASRLSTTINDLYADAQLALKLTPTKFQATQKFIHQMKELLGHDYNDYKITCVGHSLGGFIAQLASVECRNLGFEDVSTIAFDSPGAREAAITLATEGQDIDKNVENYLTRPNIVNCTNHHLGKIFYVPKLEQITESPTGMFSYLLNATGISKLCTGISDHSLQNFIDFFELKSSSEEDLLSVESWDNSFIMLNTSELLSHIKILNPDYIQFNRLNNGSNPEYLICTEIEEEWECVKLFDHNDITNFLMGNYDNQDINT